MTLLSIIIPFYNVEKYISACLDSVFNQDIPLSDYEVICVNDASPDNSREIVLKYMERYPNLRLIEHDTNKKLGAARNTGRKIAKGKYIWNVDSDDAIATNCLKRIIDICESGNLDVLRIAHDILNKQDNTYTKPYMFKTTPVLSGIDFMECYGIKNISNISPVWLQIYRRNFLEQNKIFSPEINMGEDVPYTLETYIKAKRIQCYDIIGYFYRIATFSLTNQIKKAPTPQTVYENCFICAKYVYELLPYVKNSTETFNCLKGVVNYILGTYHKYMISFSADEKAKFKYICKKHFFNNTFIFSCLTPKQVVSYIKLLLWE